MIFFVLILLQGSCRSFTTRIRHDRFLTRNIQVFAQQQKEKDIVSSSQEVFHSSEVLGDIWRLRLSGEDDESILSSVASVPTFATSGTEEGFQCSSKTRAAGLEGVLRQGPAFVVDHVVDEEICDHIINLCDHDLGFGVYNIGKNNHGAMQIVVDEKTAEKLGQALSHHINVEDVESRRIEMMRNTGSLNDQEEVRLIYAGINRRWRVYRYEPGGEETFAPHIDAGFPPSALSDDNTELLWDSSDGQDIVARLTVLLYLNDDFVGGETNFYQPSGESGSDSKSPSLIAAIRPKAGSVLVFPQAVGEEAVSYARMNWPTHEGAPVTSGQRPKYVIRSDILFVQQTEKLDLNDPYSKHDHKVRDTFLPRSAALDNTFLNHLSSLYNPHMGVENLGPFLYSFIRFTKIRQVVEIGAGYTSLWILQALKDNDDELERIRRLGRSGQCLLLDIPWAVPEYVEQYDTKKSRLLFVDNCKHQKETATGASAVAKSLGMEDYMEFLQADAFELNLEEESVDLLWCDFGVGSRMADFARKIWHSIRPGGFLICHSTLTNRGTREWLESIRSNKEESVTGIPSDEVVELSLLEPQKRYQNSISILQKRKGIDSVDYAEPIYSRYA